MIESCAVSIFGISQFKSIILDIILPINGSRVRRLPIRMEHFIDQEKYFFLIIFHINSTLLIGKIALMAVVAMLISYLHHTCGMFSIARYTNKDINNYEILKMCLSFTIYIF